MPVSASGSCQAWTAYGDCYIELTGCEGGCQFEQGPNGESSLSGTNCTGAYGQCVTGWYFELSWCGGEGPYYCGATAFQEPLVN
jgi:hypothetical protein